MGIIYKHIAHCTHILQAGVTSNDNKGSDVAISRNNKTIWASLFKCFEKSERHIFTLAKYYGIFSSGTQIT